MERKIDDVMLAAENLVQWAKERDPRGLGVMRNLICFRKLERAVEDYQRPSPVEQECLSKRN